MKRRRAAEDLRAWAEELYARHGPDVARLLGSDELPPIRIEVVRRGPWAASTDGRTVTLNADWFGSHPDDVGGCLHEFTHAIMHAPQNDASWLTEGIADHVRDVLGFDAAWTFAHHEPGKATSGYQTTAHFLSWLESRRPGVVRELARRLASGQYDRSAFEQICGATLEDLEMAYEADPVHKAGS